jgi:uncharacterized protein YbjT (DUF2867 family)
MTALIAGGTGLVGAQLLKLLLDTPEYETVIALSRRPLPSHPKLKIIITDVKTLETHRSELRANDVYCCLGTTIKSAGSRRAFEEVDFEYPVALGKIARDLGARQYLLISAKGADEDSSFFYNQVKAKTESAVTALNFPCTHIFRPSLLLGDRKEHRSGEEAAKVFFKIFGSLVPKRYRGIEAIKVARAMLHFGKTDLQGAHVHESEELQDF